MNRYSVVEPADVTYGPADDIRSMAIEYRTEIPEERAKAIELLIEALRETTPRPKTGGDFLDLPYWTKRRIELREAMESLIDEAIGIIYDVED